MKLYFCLLLTTSIVCCCSVFSQSGKPGISKEPSWISKKNIDYGKTHLDKDAQDGYADIGFENQIHLADQTEYYRISKNILSEAGVQNGSEISISFNPSFQQLTFHIVRIIRNGESINKLNLSKIKTVQQEDERSNFIYNGMMDAIIILEDVRKGDIIEYSYSIKGYNPILKNKYSDFYSFNFQTPFYEIYYKLIVPAGRKMNFKSLNNTPEPVTTEVDGQQIFEWFKKDAAPLPVQDYTPSWYDPFTRVLVSEYSSWKEVNDWALELFPGKKDLSPAINNKIKEIESLCKNDEEKTKAALRFVQDDIRYVGIEMGINSHKPADPSKVFAQRFGDCKEKSYLLCCILKAMNIEANPVLINTSDKKNIENSLPTPNAFDHVTVRVKLGDAYYWYDPTISYQRGNIKELFYPDYQMGLVISSNTNALTPIEFKNNSYQHVKEYFRVTDMTGSGTLAVTTEFKGTEADYIRQEFNKSSIGELMITYQKFYAVYYDDIKADSLTYSDNDSLGTFTVKEYYSIPKFWEVVAGGRTKFSFAAFCINSNIRRVKEKQRMMPFSLEFPVNIEEEVTVELPKTWAVTKVDRLIMNAGYSYSCKFYSVNNLVHLDAAYKNFKDYVTAEEAKEYLIDINTYDEYSYFAISSGDESETPDAKSISDKTGIATLVAIGLVIGGVSYWRKRNRF